MIANRCSPAGERARLSILTYHRVLAEQDALFPNEVTAQRFDQQMSLLKRVFNVLPLEEAVERLKSGTLPERAISITFDDGYADNVTIALPILQRHGLAATFFIATAYLNGGRMFNDTVIEVIRRSTDDFLDLECMGLGTHVVSSAVAKVSAINHILSQVKYLPEQAREEKVALLCTHVRCGQLPDNLMMTTQQLKDLHQAGMGIGAHTAHHPILAGMSADAVRQEIVEGRQFLEALLGLSVNLFAYPNGKPGVDFMPEQAHIVRELGFAAAVTTQSGAATRSSDGFQLPRFTPWRSNSAYFIPELLLNLRNHRSGKHA